MQMLRRFLKDEAGATAIEYGLIAALIAVVLIGALGNLGTALQDAFADIAAELDVTVTP
jgi:pilus assembly protein Flp/PilA